MIFSTIGALLGWALNSETTEAPRPLGGSDAPEGYWISQIGKLLDQAENARQKLQRVLVVG